MHEDELVTPAALAVRYCHQRGFERVVLVMNEEVKRDFAELEETPDRAQVSSAISARRSDMTSSTTLFAA